MVGVRIGWLVAAWVRRCLRKLHVQVGGKEARQDASETLGKKYLGTFVLNTY